MIKRCVDYEKGEAAVTFYHRLASHKNMSLMELHLETGRTHQIRVHMGYRVSPSRRLSILPGLYLFPRQPLHSLQLEFRRPVTGESCVSGSCSGGYGQRIFTNGSSRKSQEAPSAKDPGPGSYLVYSEE